MTEGIIQNVFKKFKQEYFFSPSILIHIEKYEQELIAEIRKELEQIEYEDNDGLWSYPEYIQNERVKISKWLIGDNQE